MNMIRIALCVLSFAACAPLYTPPNFPTGKLQNEVTVDKPFQEVWSAVIDHATSTYFGVENFEKESGLMTLSFGGRNPDRFIDCGWLKTTNLANYDGTAVQAIQREALATTLSGRMNIVVRAESPNRTRLRANARYVYVAQGKQSRPTWTFESNTSDTQRVGTVMVTCRPTNVAEQDLLKGVGVRLAR
jgi:hypothetical protein